MADVAGYPPLNASRGRKPKISPQCHVRPLGTEDRAAALHVRQELRRNWQFGRQGAYFLKPPGAAARRGRSAPPQPAPLPPPQGGVRRLRHPSSGAGSAGGGEAPHSETLLLIGPRLKDRPPAAVERACDGRPAAPGRIGGGSPPEGPTGSNCHWLPPAGGGGGYGHGYWRRGGRGTKL
jgi:hypothetical protein